MAALTPAGRDRLVIFGLGLATCTIIGVMRRILVYYREAAVVPPAESRPQYITQEVEDSLKLSTLSRLLDNPSYCIQETASIIVCERALHDQKAIETLLWYITRPDHESREQGVRALTMIVNSTSVGLFNKPEAWAALVKSLEYSLTDYPHNPFDPEWDNWHLRDIVEQCLLLVLAQLVERFGPGGLVKSRFVERWLAKEPWADHESDRITRFADSLHGNQRLLVLTRPLFRDHAGRRQLIQAGLVPQELLGDPNLKRAVRLAEEEEDVDRAWGVINGDGRRRRDQTSEEDHIRRRHREAMVLNDGTRPLVRGDIFQRER